MKYYDALKIFLDKQQRFPKSAEGYLGEWCSTQRKMRKQGKLSPNRQTLLDRIGFVWSVELGWRSFLEQLHQFLGHNGRWPGCREGALGRWWTVQRRNYRRGSLSDQKIAQLEQIGFIPLKGDKKYRRNGNTLISYETIEFPQPYYRSSKYTMILEYNIPNRFRTIRHITVYTSHP